MLNNMSNTTKFPEAEQTYGLVFVADTDITSGSTYKRPVFISISD